MVTARLGVNYNTDKYTITEPTVYLNYPQFTLISLGAHSVSLSTSIA